MHATGGLSTDSVGAKEQVGRWLHRAGLVEHPVGVATSQLQQAFQLAVGSCGRLPPSSYLFVDLLDGLPRFISTEVYGGCW